VAEEVDVGCDRDLAAVERQPQVDPRLARLTRDVRAPLVQLRGLDPLPPDPPPRPLWRSAAGR